MFENHRGDDGDDAERDEHDGGNDEVSKHQRPAVDGQRIGAFGLVDFLRQRLHQFKAENEQAQAAGDDGRRGATVGGDLGKSGEHDHQLHACVTARRELEETLHPAACDRGQSATTLERQPRGRTHLFLTELAAQQHDGADVLECDGEAKLCDKVAATSESLERQCSNQEDADRGGDCGDADGDQIDRFDVQRPQRHAAERIEGARCIGIADGDGGLPEHQCRSNQGGERVGQAQPVDNERCTNPDQSDACAVDGAVERPRTERAGKATRGELSCGRTGKRTCKCRRTQTLDGGFAKGGTNVERSEKDMAHFGVFDSDRPAACSAAHAEKKRDGDNQPENVRAVFGDVRNVVRSGDRVLEDAGDEEHAAANDDGGEIHAVEGFEPFGFLHTTVPTS